MQMAYPSHGLVLQVKIEDIGISPLLALQDVLELRKSPAESALGAICIRGLPWAKTETMHVFANGHDVATVPR